jgi:hypothetical protein
MGTTNIIYEVYNFVNEFNNLIKIRLQKSIVHE